MYLGLINIGIGLSLKFSFYKKSLVVIPRGAYDIHIRDGHVAYWIAGKADIVYADKLPNCKHAVITNRDKLDRYIIENKKKVENMPRIAKIKLYYV